MRSISVFATSLFLASSLLAVDNAEYQALRAARPDGRSIAVKDLALKRDAYQLRFNGTFHLLAPVAGKTFGAVFLGTGSYDLRPASEAERRQLVLSSGTRDLEVLTDTFDRMVLLFSDGTADEVSAAGTITTGSPDTRARQVFEEYLNDQKRKYRINLHLRVLQDLLNTPPSAGVFVAVVDGARLAPALLIVDPYGISAVTARFADLSGETTAFLSFDTDNDGFWYLASAGDKRARGVAPRASVDALHYTIDTSIESNLEIKANTTIRLRPNVAGMRVIPLNILPKLRLRRATFTPEGGAAQEVAFVQEEVELGRLARLFREEVADADAAVILPQAAEVGKTAELRVEYEGREVLQSVGADSWSVRARESWYPNTGTFVDTATYDLTYRFPRKNNLVSTGKLVSETDDAGRKTSVWKADVPMRVAGFNFGRFDRTSRNDEQSGTQVDVYTTGDRRKFASDSIADALNTARVGTVFFGKAPYSPVSVTQQAEWNFGQSWPSLIYLPTLALTSSTERVDLFEQAGPAVFEINEFAKMVGWHEFAHQWWGHAVGWQSYRDQWLSEGFAEFTSALTLLFTEKHDKYDDYWERRRKEILQRMGRSSIAANDAGPISQGFRLSTRHSPGAYQTVIYSKGAYVLHMLRAMMRDQRSKNSDERFIAMMKDFVTSYSGKSPSTADFQKVVERHMTKSMDAAENGKMDWFFDQWVFGTEVPRLKSALTATDAGGGKFRINGSVTQEAVSSDFRSIVPVYADFGKEGTFYIGALRLVGNTTQTVDIAVPMPKLPRRIVANAFHDVLARD